MFGWTWGRWGDPFTDLGRELYVPWQLAQGKVLYRDIAYFNGPLSPYFNSLWFRAFGPGFWVLAGVNCGLIAAMVTLLFFISQYVADRLSATLACIVFVCLFAFAVLIPQGNFSYITPYSHEMTHGILLCLGILAAMAGFLKKQRLIYFFLIALSTGLLQLTKIEMSLAGLATGLSAAMFLIWHFGNDKKTRWQMTGLFALGFFGPAVIAFVLLALAMPVSQAFRGALSPFLVFFYNGVTSMPFYQAIMGLDCPMICLKDMFIWAGGFLAVVAWISAFSLIARKNPGWISKAALFMVFIPVILVSLFRHKITWGFFASPYGLFLLGGLVWGWAVWWKHRHHTSRAGVYAVRIVFVVLALSLLPKMLLNQRIYLYGFCLGMPATMVFVLALMHWIPQVIGRAGGAVNLFKAGIISLIVFVGVVHIQGTYSSIAPRIHSMGQGLDFMVWDSRARAFNAVLKTMEKTIPQGSTMATLPACVMFNYLGRIPNSTPYIMCIPPEMAMFGKDNILAAYKKAPPDFILLVHQDNTQYGAQYFGKDYGQEFYTWILDQYENVALIGPRPFMGEEGGVLLMKRKAAFG